MALTVIPRWVLLRLASLPWFWVLASGTVGAFLLSWMIEPAMAPDRSWYLLLGLLGAILGLLLLSEIQGLQRLLPWRSRWSGEVSALLVTTLVLQFPTWAAARLVATPELALGRELLAILCLDLRLVAVALLVLFVPIHGAARALVLLAIVWLGPLLIPWSSPLGPGLSMLLDLRNSAPFEGAAQSLPDLAARLGPTLATGLASLLLRAPTPARAPSLAP